MRLRPGRRPLRLVVTVAIVLAVLALLWFWVFPWLDRTFVNRPAIEALGRLSGTVVVG